MTTLLVVLWCVYASDCLVRHRSNAWVFRGRGRSHLQAESAADLELLTGRFSLTRQPFAPWRVAFVAAGERLDYDAALTHIERVLRQVRALRIACTALFALLLVALTVVVAADVSGLILRVWAGVTLAVWLTVLILAARAHRHIHGVRMPAEKFTTLLLSPVAASRSTYAVLADALIELHPMAAAAVLCGDAEFLRVARLWRYDMPELRADVTRLARARGLVAALDAAPGVAEHGLARFCPRCHTAYASRASQCADCRDVTLEPLPLP